ncbi:MAG: hypothetical protein U0411_13490 [Thermodesulfovibrionales bacterium]
MEKEKKAVIDESAAETSKPVDHSLWFAEPLAALRAQAEILYIIEEHHLNGSDYEMERIPDLLLSVRKAIADNVKEIEIIHNRMLHAYDLVESRNGTYGEQKLLSYECQRCGKKFDSHDAIGLQNMYFKMVCNYCGRDQIELQKNLKGQGHLTG